MLIIDTKSIRDTKKDEKRRRSRSDRFVNETEKKKKNISTFDERKRNF